MGRRDQFRRTQFRVGPRIFHHERTLLDRGISFRRISVSTQHTRFAMNQVNTLSRAVGRAAREAAGSRSIILVAENDLQEAKMARPRERRRRRFGRHVE